MVATPVEQLLTKLPSPGLSVSLSRCRSQLRRSGARRLAFKDPAVARLGQPSGVDGSILVAGHAGR